MARNRETRMWLNPPRICDAEDARRLARRRLPRPVFDFVDGAAGREAGAARNEARFDEILLQPRILTRVEGRNVSTRVMGESYRTPFGIAPMGLCDLARPRADRALARAAADLGFPVCVSSAASSRIEDMVRWSGGNAWFQLYFSRSEEATLAAAIRARDAGCETLVLTVDVPQVARRSRDIRNGFDLPFRLTARALWQFASRPAWSVTTLAAGVPAPRNFAVSADDAEGGGFDRHGGRSGADWRFLDKLRRQWPGNLAVKGVTLPEDAVRLRDAGVDAVYVSNHGARQLDGVPASIDALPLVRHALGRDFPVLFDSGARSGEDVVKALALGADFVMLGRPVLFAIAAGGEAGLRQYLGRVTEDIDTTLAQLGLRSLAEVGPEALRARAPSGSLNWDGPGPRVPPRRRPGPRDGDGEAEARAE